MGLLEHILYRASRGVDKVHHAYVKESAKDIAGVSPKMDRTSFLEIWLQVDDAIVVDTLFSICELPVQVNALLTCLSPSVFPSIIGHCGISLYVHSTAASTSTSKKSRGAAKLCFGVCFGAFVIACCSWVAAVRALSVI